MAKKEIKKKNIVQAGNKAEALSSEEKAYSPHVEKIFKIILRSMSWIVGVAFVLVILLPQFNSEFLDNLTQIIFYIAIINLLVFIIIEFISDSVKQMMSRLLHE